MSSVHIPTRTGLTSKDELRLLRGFSDQTRRQWIRGKSLDTDKLVRQMANNIKAFWEGKYTLEPLRRPATDPNDREAENNDLPLTAEAT